MIGKRFVSHDELNIILKATEKRISQAGLSDAFKNISSIQFEGGGLLYVDGGVLKYKGPSGTITVLGAA